MTRINCENCGKLIEDNKKVHFYKFTGIHFSDHLAYHNKKNNFNFCSTKCLREWLNRQEL